MTPTKSGQASGDNLSPVWQGARLNAPLDDWLRRTAQQHQRRGISKTFVAISDDEPTRILGYHALTACAVLTEELPADLANKLLRKLPGMRLGRLAVGRTVQGQGLGEHLLMDEGSGGYRALLKAKTQASREGRLAQGSGPAPGLSDRGAGDAG